MSESVYLDARKKCKVCGEELLNKLELRTGKRVEFCQRCEPKEVYIEVERW